MRLRIGAEQRGFVVPRALFALILATGCTHLERRERPAPDAEAPIIYPQYWLTHTVLLDMQGGRPVANVEAPRLVELLPGGRVRSHDTTTPPLDGYLPSEVLQEPGRNRGLMLYAQRVGEMHCDHPGSSPLGRVHPGAFLSVVPTDDRVVRIGSLPFAWSRKDFNVYVARDILGTTPQPPIDYRPPGRVWSVRMPHVEGWIRDCGPSVAWSAIECEDAWVYEDFRVSQYSRGVEVVGESEHFNASTLPGAISSHEALHCPARTITSPNAPIPSGYRRLELPATDPLAQAITQGRAIHWLLQTERGPICDEWRFAKNRLTRVKPFRANSGNVKASYPIDYHLSSEGRPAVLHLETLEFDGRPALMCPCQYDYFLLHADAGELELMARTMPEAVVAYDPRDAERWFLSREKCEIARAEVARAISQDGLLATQLGLHAVVSSLGL